jgi:putative component of membrane protein insertase Oxa1/YidC/SpoIIIJ protein YidD
MRSAALFAITLYQRYLSPYKGYCCAYRSYTGGASCSTLGFRVIRRFGIWDGLALLRERLALCGAAYRRWVRARLPARRQKGFIDGACDVGICLPDPGDLASGCCDPSAGCDIGDWMRDDKKKKDERKTHLPRFCTDENEGLRRSYSKRQE